MTVVHAKSYSLLQTHCTPVPCANEKISAYRHGFIILVV
jgi:hypothetical protein